MKERQKFEIVLAIIVFFLTVVGSIISGYVVYRLTNSERPLITLSVLEYNQTTGVLSFKISNFRDMPANRISVYYQIKDSRELTNKKELFSIDNLYKGDKIEEIKFNRIKSEIVWGFEDYLELKYVNESEGFSIELFYSKSEFKIDNETNKTLYHVTINKKSIVPEYYSIIFSASCDNCKSDDVVINPYELEYDLQLNCTKVEDYFNCKVEKEYIDLS